MPLKKIISTCLLLLVLLLPGTILIGFQLRQWHIKHEMEEKLEKENLQTLTIAAGQLKWEEEGKELNVDGMLFDVKSIVQLGDGSFEVSGLFDQEETMIQKKSADFASKKSSSDNSSKILFQTLHFTFFFENIQAYGFKLPLLGQLPFQPAKEAGTLELTLAGNYPPPEL